MKYFTKEWYYLKEGEESKKIMEAYRTYIDKVYDQLPLILQLFARTISLHDGILEEVLFVKDGNILTFKAMIPTWTTWYFKIEIIYTGISNLSIGKLNSFFKNKIAEILYNEVEILPNEQYSHRIFFGSKKDLEIIFKDIEISIQNLHPDDFNEKKRCKLQII